ncbi:cytoplasmic protein NCK2-like [Actinia tenebrosa]|uniref:Cytoplasmic protein NCK2-like n=1 Tax=Actinia tenebrosa TaxID=6105 RepID=A0A6P8H8M0_ACTTE|nr:cytoplasmic protein NCK2-like [Actinia tenebrosa]
MGDESIAIALYEYNAQQKEELSIKKNEKLTIIDDSQTWWKVKNERNQSGYVPSNYVDRKGPKKQPVQILKNIFGKGAKKGQSDSNGYDNERNQYCTPESVLIPPHTKAAICQVKAKFSYKPRNKDELELNKGNLIDVLEKEHDGWWKGRSGNNVGWFPSNYAEEDTLSENPNFKVVALYPFSSSNPEELNFEKDEILDIIRQPEGDPDWWEAKKSDGKTGLVPKNYVKTLSEDAPARPPSQSHPTKKLPLSPNDSAQAFQKVLLPSHKALSFGNEEWFWGQISRENGEKLLGIHGDNGDFLLRESETRGGDFSVSMKAPDRIKHFRIQTLDSGYKIGQRTFDSLDALIEHYKKSPIFTNEKGDKMYLVKPVVM